MKSLQRRWDNITGKNQNKSSYLCFAEAITGQNFNERIIRLWFNKLVEKDDYAKNEKKAVLEFLVNLTTPVSNVENGG